MSKNPLFAGFDLERAVEAAFGAKGALDDAAAMSAIDAALAMSPHDQGEARTTAARLQDLMNAGNVKGARQVAGFVTQMQAQTRVKNMTRLGANLVPAVNSVMTQGNTMEQAGEIVGTLNDLTSDAEGAVSKTAANNLTSKPAAFVP